ncbi:uncharacterized protein LOC116215548 isoform X2 [Punica granatum]|uniref:Uncharacterized protein LOC116215548 isoform X2 n=1 Tax=Punica granatum TaxID=22663 RepID=A0A6P8EML8_PUNGR|nr:uncharacterized protein LOC116215548 isoform X2 [Punica granatum]
MLGIILYLHEMVEVVVLVKGVNKKSVLSEPGTLLLKVMFKPSGRSCYSVALDGLLWACRPTTVFLTASYPFVKQFSCPFSLSARHWQTEKKMPSAVKAMSTVGSTKIKA